MKDKEHKFTVFIPIEVSVTRDENYDEHLKYVLGELGNLRFSTMSGSYDWRKKKCKVSKLIVKDLWKS